MFLKKNSLSSYLKFFIVLKFQIIYLSPLTQNEGDNKTASETNSKGYNTLDDRILELFADEGDNMNKVVNIFSELKAMYEHNISNAAVAPTQNFVSSDPVSNDNTKNIEVFNTKIPPLSRVLRNQMQPESFKNKELSSKNLILNERITDMPMPLGSVKHSIIVKNGKYPELLGSIERGTSSSQKSELPTFTTLATFQKEGNNVEKPEIKIQSNAIMNGNHSLKNNNNTSTLPQLLTKQRQGEWNINNNKSQNRVDKDNNKLDKSNNGSGNNNNPSSLFMTRLKNLPLNCTTSNYQNDDIINLSTPDHQQFGLNKILSNLINSIFGYKNCSKDHELVENEVNYQNINKTSDLNHDEFETKLNFSTTNEEQLGLKNIKKFLSFLVNFVSSYKNFIKDNDHELSLDDINYQNMNRTSNSGVKSIRNNTELTDNFQESINKTPVINKTKTFHMFGWKSYASPGTITYLANVFYHILIN